MLWIHVLRDRASHSIYKLKTCRGELELAGSTKPESVQFYRTDCWKSERSLIYENDKALPDRNAPGMDRMIGGFAFASRSS